MPVADHPTHERTKIGSDFRYGCFNRKRLKTYYFAPGRNMRLDGSFTVGCRKIKDVLSRECKYDMSDNDTGCSGCKWRIMSTNDSA